MNVVEKDIRNLVYKELQNANKMFPAFTSDHEALAVILEEANETMNEIKTMSNAIMSLWNDVKTNTSESIKIKHSERIRESAVRTACEAIQVAAMAIKFVESKDAKKLEDWNKPTVTKK